MSVKNLLIDFDDSASVEDIISRCRTDFLCNVFGRSLEKGSFQWDKSELIFFATSSAGPLKRGLSNGINLLKGF